MQFSAAEIRFIVTTYFNSTFTNDLKRKYFFFRKMFIVTEYAALKSSIEEGRHSYLKYNRLIVDGQECTYDYDNARPVLARK